MMPNAARVDRVGQDVMHVAIAECCTTLHPARDQRSDGSLKAKRVNRFFDDTRVPMLEVEIIDRAGRESGRWEHESSENSFGFRATP